MSKDFCVSQAFYSVRVSHLKSLQPQSNSYLSHFYGDSIVYTIDSFLFLSWVNIFLWLIIHQEKIYIYYILGRILNVICLCSIELGMKQVDVPLLFIHQCHAFLYQCVGRPHLPPCMLLRESWQKRLHCSFARFLMTSLCLHMDELIGNPLTIFWLIYF